MKFLYPEYVKNTQTSIIRKQTTQFIKGWHGYAQILYQRENKIHK